MQSNELLLPSLAGSMYFLIHYSKQAVKQTNTGSFINGIEKKFNVPFVFAFIVLIQALFGAQGFKPPSRLVSLFKIPLIRFIALFLIVTSGTKDVEVTIFTVASFLILMQIIRTPEERKEHPYLI